MSQRRLTRIMAKEGSIEIRQEIQPKAAAGWDKTTLVSPDRANPEFYSALQRIKPFFLSKLDLPASWGSGVEMIGIILTYPEPDDLGIELKPEKVKGKKGDVAAATAEQLKEPDPIMPMVQFIAQKDLIGCETPMVLKVPPDYYGKEALDAITELCMRAEEYLNGDRAQMNLFKQAGEEIEGLRTKADAMMNGRTEPSRRGRPRAEGVS